MRFEPQRAGRNGGIYSNLPPPSGFNAGAMHLAMVPSTQGHGELIAYFAAKRPALREAQVMGFRGLAAANQKRLLGHISDVSSVQHPARLRQSQYALIDRLRSRPVLRPLGWMRIVHSERLLNFPWRLRPVRGTRRKDRQSSLEAPLHMRGIGCRALVFFDERPMCPDCCVVAANKNAELAEKSIA
jgi:hypothetical protein